MIRILLAEDHGLVRAGLCRIIGECEDIEVVAEAENGQQALSKIRAIRPDILTKGSNFKIDQVAGRQLLTESGGQVRLIPIDENISTSTLVERIRGKK